MKRYTSAGGIFVGGAITERPDLFGAALIRVGDSDMLRLETTEAGPANIMEFGTVKTLEGFKGLLAMSPYHRVKDGVAYPAVLLTTGVNDNAGHVLGAGENGGTPPSGELERQA